MSVRERLSSGALGALCMGYWAWTLVPIPYSLNPGSIEMTFTIAGLVVGTVVFGMVCAILGLMLWLTAGFKKSIPCYLIGALITGVCTLYIGMPIGYGQWIGATSMFLSISVAASLLIFAVAPNYFGRSNMI